MLIVAVKFELRALLRSRAGAIALLAFLVAGALAVVVGQRHVAKWRDAIAMADEAQARSVAEALGQVADTPQVDLSRPLSQDKHAGSRIARVPGPLAGIAAGAVDPTPAAFRVTFWADPTSVGGYRIENPELARGAVDLVFVLTLLLPLLMGVLGLGIGGRERESGLDRLIMVQAGSTREWLVARTIAVCAMAGGAAVVLCFGAAAVGGASLAETTMLAGVAALYAVVWGGLLLAVNARAPSVQTAAFTFGVLWTLLCIVVPAVGSEVAFARVESDFAVAETVGARTQRFEAYERKIEALLPQFYARYPELKALPAAQQEPLDHSLRRHVHGALAAAAVADKHAERVGQERSARRVAEIAAWFSPTVAVTLAAERLAGVGPEAGASYRSSLIDAVQDRVAWVLVRAWAERSLTRSDFQALVDETPASFRARPSGFAGPTLTLLVWAVLIWGLALARPGLAR